MDNNIEFEDKEPPIQIFSKVMGEVGVNVVKVQLNLQYYQC